LSRFKSIAHSSLYESEETHRRGLCVRIDSGCISLSLPAEREVVTHFSSLPLAKSPTSDDVDCSHRAGPWHRPYSEQRHDRYESEAVRDRLTVFPMASAVKS